MTWSIPLVIDPAMPRGVAELRDSDGHTVAAIVFGEQPVEQLTPCPGCGRARDDARLRWCPACRRLGAATLTDQAMAVRP